eukprot:CAMPEP_0168365766 /NCGR_PEP_ID=MMETSP0228-20121227/4886_1 /TAXON_ID=133427 /ORGANISM="Protoceratium reticulatum, Strain CCCM 535 (=CCMP 1889)" /LENGTH=568 /DNA_ID=CAMNT_0008378555 /DNA_START=74 /DNA_END=1780 /DNA_ORIENTATION=+
MAWLWSLILSPAIVFAVGAYSWPGEDVIATTSFGRIIGQQTVRADEQWPSVCEEWIGVPYAKAPVGALRLTDTRPWDEVYPKDGLKAKRHRSICTQVDMKKKAHGDEDCLFMNIWRPSNSENNLTVMVWIHGGGFMTGGGDDPTPGSIPAPVFVVNSYDGCEMAARQNVIIVTFNYRLGHMGFAAFETPNGMSSNFGFKDQQEALRWIQREANAFGGDAERVTVFGESAGGDSVWMHVASPASRGLFRAGIVESGMTRVVAGAVAVEQTKNWAARAGCLEEAHMLACLQNKTVVELTDVDTDANWNPYALFPWSPSVDGISLKDQPVTIIKQGLGANVPLLAGANTNEGALFVYTFYNEPLTAANYPDFVQGLLKQFDPTAILDGNQMAKLFQLYPISPNAAADNRAIASQLVTDVTFTCSTQDIARALSEAEGRAPFYLFRFDHRSGCFNTFLKTVPGVFHSAELDYVFNTPFSQFCLWSAEERQLSRRMQAMWATFAQDLTAELPPDVKGGISKAPPYHNCSKRGIVFRSTSDAIEQDYRGEHCEFWREAIYSKYVQTAGQIPLTV